MDWSTGFSWWSSLRRHRDPDTGGADRGDMGTAFGLDASFDGPAAPVEPVDTAAAVAGATPWEYRLVRRSGL